MLRSLISLLRVIVLLAACAPENLDITPSPTPTDIPSPTLTRTPSPTPDPAAESTMVAESASEDASDTPMLDAVIAAVPGRISGGAVQWIRGRNETTQEAIVYQELEGGRSARLFFTEAGGGAMELTIAAFESAEAAAAYYEQIRGQLRTLENSTANDTFPQPNAFGGGTYGWDAIFSQDNLFVRISVPRVSSTAGNPLLPLARQMFNNILPSVTAS